MKLYQGVKAKETLFSQYHASALMGLLSEKFPAVLSIAPLLLGKTTCTQSEATPLAS